MPDRTSDPALTGPWTIYRTWAQTAAFEKGRLDWLTRQSLRLGIAGAILATLGQQLATPAPRDARLAIACKAIGILGAAGVALSAYLSKQALADDRLSRWARARTAAASLNSLIYLYRARVPPFDGADRAKQLISRTDAIVSEVKDVEPRSHDGLPTPSATLSVDDYLAERLQAQIEWYERRAAQHQANADFSRTITALLGGIGALLALATAAAYVSGWAAVIATITASITANMNSQRLRTLVTTYRSTAMRLRLLASEWAGSGKSEADTAERNALINRCEQTMATETGAWSALWTQKGNAARESASPAG